MCQSCNNSAGQSDKDALRSFLSSDRRFRRARSTGAIQNHLGWDGNRLIAAVTAAGLEFTASVQRPGVTFVTGF